MAMVLKRNIFSATVLSVCGYLDFTWNSHFGVQNVKLGKCDPVDLTGLKRQSWSQNLRSLSQKTKKRGNNAVTRRFGKYSFYLVLCLSQLMKNSFQSKVILILSPFNLSFQDVEKICRVQSAGKYFYHDITAFFVINNYLTG